MASSSTTYMVGTIWSDGRSGSGLNPTTETSRTWSVLAPVKRARPALLIIKNGTARSHSGWEKVNDVVVDSGVGGSPPANYIRHSLVSSHVGLGTWSWPAGTYGDRDTMVYNQMLAQARQITVNLANMLGEYKQTASMFGNLSKQVASLTKAVIKRDPRILLYGHELVKARRVINGRAYLSKSHIPKGVTRQSANFLADNWLQYVYGVKPLMGDMDKIIKILRDRVASSEPIIQRVSWSGSEKASRQYTARSILDGTRYPACLVKETGKRSYKWFADVKFKNQVLNNTLGSYGFTNPLALAWELMPFSFVIDWWVNVGETLQSLDNSLYIDTSDSWCQSTSRTFQKRVVNVGGVTGYYNQWTWSRSGPQQLYWPVAKLRFKPNVSSWHIANGTALLVNLADSVLGRRR